MQLSAFYYEEDILFGVVGLKQPSEVYKRRIFSEAGVLEELDNYDLEIGWAFTEKEYRGRGICPRLILKIFSLSKSQNFFATAHIDNTPIHRVLQKTGFEKIGKPYLGRDNRYCRLLTRSKS